MDYATFFSRFGGSARSKHVLPVDAGVDEWASKRDKRPFRLPAASEMPKEFIRLCPWEVEYLFAVARRARVGIVETGRFNGGSLFVMACAAPEHVPIYSIDRRPRDDAFLRQKLDQFCPHRRIELIVGDSQRGSYPQVGTIDLVFIDGDHSYQGCLNDIRNWYGRLVDNGHLIFHDSYLGPHGVQDAIADFIESHPELEIVRSPFIGATHWMYPTGSIAHLIKRGPTKQPAG
jgi:predicted O-methyltransferase YrrM